MKRVSGCSVYLIAPVLTCCLCDLRRSPVHDEKPPQIAREARDPRTSALWQRKRALSSLVVVVCAGGNVANLDMAGVAKADGKCRFRVLPLGGLNSNSTLSPRHNDLPRLMPTITHSLHFYQDPLLRHEDGMWAVIYLSILRLYTRTATTRCRKQLCYRCIDDDNPYTSWPALSKARRFSFALLRSQIPCSYRPRCAFGGFHHPDPPSGGDFTCVRT